MSGRETCQHPGCDSAEAIRAAESDSDDWGPWWFCPSCTVALCVNVTADSAMDSGVGQ